MCMFKILNGLSAICYEPNKHKTFNQNNNVYIANFKTLYYPTDAQIYNSYIQLELL